MLFELPSVHVRISVICPPFIPFRIREQFGLFIEVCSQDYTGTITGFQHCPKEHLQPQPFFHLSLTKYDSLFRKSLKTECLKYRARPSQTRRHKAIDNIHIYCHSAFRPVSRCHVTACIMRKAVFSCTWRVTRRLQGREVWLIPSFNLKGACTDWGWSASNTRYVSDCCYCSRKTCFSTVLPRCSETLPNGNTHKNIYAYTMTPWVERSASFVYQITLTLSFIIVKQ